MGLGLGLGLGSAAVYLVRVRFRARVRVRVRVRERRAVPVTAAHQPHVLHHRAGPASVTLAVQPEQARQTLRHHPAAVAELSGVVAPPREDMPCLAQGRAVPPTARDLRKKR